MEYRRLGSTGLEISAIGFGGWPIGGSWGTVTEDDAMDALHAAVDAGVTFFDTADRYGDGRSEQLVGRLRRDRPDAAMIVATKVGRRLDPHVADGYTAVNLEAFVDRSLSNLGMEQVDLLQLHSPPTAVYYRPEVFSALDSLVAKGKIRHYGASVKTVEEALKAIEFPGVASIQILFNLFRQRPAGLFFGQATRRNVGIIVRVPLASGLLSGRMTRTTVFETDDHRRAHRDGTPLVDPGETFAGVDFETGLAAVDELRPLVPAGASLAQFALRWILMHDAVSTVIPGIKTAEQARQNAAAADLEPLPDETMKAVAEIYEFRIKDQVHHRY
ncbi:MAG TPA: aldo/keto reductase [Acidimicrobiia bacterium]|jgi:aryl-alcohol dehydrogenase-like predicted oxidoreductase|nr:aldo/keto reductase [Acidimicrobiia bacterium]